MRRRSRIARPSLWQLELLHWMQFFPVEDFRAAGFLYGFLREVRQRFSDPHASLLHRLGSELRGSMGSAQSRGNSGKRVQCWFGRRIAEILFALLRNFSAAAVFLSSFFPDPSPPERRWCGSHAQRVKADLLSLRSHRIRRWRAFDLFRESCRTATCGAAHHSAILQRPARPA